jgi:hypothetical protein
VVIENRREVNTGSAAAWNAHDAFHVRTADRVRASDPIADPAGLLFDRDARAAELDGTTVQFPTGELQVVRLSTDR